MRSINVETFVLDLSLTGAQSLHDMGWLVVWWISSFTLCSYQGIYYLWGGFERCALVPFCWFKTIWGTRKGEES